MFATFLALALGASLHGAGPEVLSSTAATAPAVADTVAAIRAVREQTILEVDNAAYLDADVYALQGFRRVRLGTVTGLTKSKLVIPRDLVGFGQPLRFIIHPIGGNRNSVSDELIVSQGDTVGLFVSPF